MASSHQVLSCGQVGLQLELRPRLRRLGHQSARGVRQGDPLGPLWFSLGVQPVIEALLAQLGPHRKVLAYLDDIFILSTNNGALQDAKTVIKGWSSTIRLNPTKCRTISLADIKENGFEMLGTLVGSRDARAAFLRSAIDTEKKKIATLPPLQHQSALLLLRKCLSADLRHLQRALQTDDMADKWEAIDLAIWVEIKHIQGQPELDGIEGLRTTRLGGPSRLSRSVTVAWGCCPIETVHHTPLLPQPRLPTRWWT